MKKNIKFGLLSFLTAAALSFGFAACSQPSNGETSSSSSSSSSSSTALDPPVKDNAPKITLGCESSYFVAPGEKFKIPVNEISVTDDHDTVTPTYEVTCDGEAVGLRHGGQGKVMKRLTLSNEWQGFSFTKQQILDMGFDSLEGIQLSVELYEAGKGQDGWCPVAFNTYIDNFTFIGIEEPTEKADNVVLDFANYRDMDDINSEYATYEFLNSKYTLNGVGSMKFSCPSGRWPTMTLGSKFSKYDLEYVKSLVLDVYVPTIADGTNVRIGANDKGYQRLYASDAGEWKTVKIPVSALSNGSTFTTLEDVKLTFARNNGSEDINFGTLYIGKVALEYYDVDPNDKDHVKPAGVLYDFYDAEEAAKIQHPSTSGDATDFDNKKTAKLVMTHSEWGKITMPAEVDTVVTDMTKVSYVYVDLYVQATLADGEYVRYAWYYPSSSSGEKYCDVIVKANQWITLHLPVDTTTAKMSDFYFYLVKKGVDGWAAIGSTTGEALYVSEIGYTSNDTALRDFDTGFETTANMGMFYKTNQDYYIFRNSDSAYVKEGSYSLGFVASPKWPIYYFTTAFQNWAKAQGYTSISFDIYIDDPNGKVSGKEGLLAGVATNEWKTVTVAASKFATKLQINKSAATNIFFYIDNLVFTK